MQVPTSAVNFVELEALRWENRKLSDAKAVAETEVRFPVRIAASWWLLARHLRHQGRATRKESMICKHCNSFCPKISGPGKTQAVGR